MPNRGRDYPRVEEHILEAKRMTIVVDESIQSRDDNIDERELQVLIQVGILNATIAMAEYLGRLVALAEEAR
jgi:hypothetical protein